MVPDAAQPSDDGAPDDQDDELDHEANAWITRADELLEYTWKFLVCRTDIYGRYTSKGGQFTERGIKQNKSGLWVFSDKPKLTDAVILKHFRATSSRNIIGLHNIRAELVEGPDGPFVINLSPFCTNDIDHHGEGDAPEVNTRAALYWHDVLVDLGFHPLTFQSNGCGGYRNYIVFSEIPPTNVAFHFIRWLMRDFKDVGLAQMPEAWPKQEHIGISEIVQPIEPDGEPSMTDCGSWVRLFGRHHKRKHYTRFWDGKRVLIGDDAIDWLLNHTGDDP